MKAVLMVSFLLLSCAVFAQEISIKNGPDISVRTDKELYGSGESGTLFIEISTYGPLKDVDLEAVITSPEGVITGGALLVTDLPEKTFLGEDLVQMEQIISESRLDHLYGDRTLKLVDFQIPEAAPSGEYVVTTRLYTSGNLYEKSITMQVAGQGAANSIVLIYIIIIVSFGYFVIKR